MCLLINSQVIRTQTEKFFDSAVYSRSDLFVIMLIVLSKKSKIILSSVRTQKESRARHDSLFALVAVKRAVCLLLDDFCSSSKNAEMSKSLDDEASVFRAFNQPNRPSLLVYIRYYRLNTFSVIYSSFGRNRRQSSNAQSISSADRSLSPAKESKTNNNRV